MEQTPSSPHRAPELPSVSVSPERRSGDAPRPESLTGSSLEQREQRSEASPADGQAAALAAPAVALPATPVIASDDDATGAQPVVSSPTIANDDDLIEKEWVDRAKKVLAETRDDPYRREQEVSRLQEDYLMKRYGRKLGSLQ